jgi:hypothetical protein
VFDDSDFDETRLVGEDNRLHAVAYVELLEDASDVSLYGSVADDELSGNLGVREPGRRALEHSSTGGQPMELLREAVQPARLPPKFLDYGTRDCTAKRANVRQYFGPI